MNSSKRNRCVARPVTHIQEDLIGQIALKRKAVVRWQRLMLEFSTSKAGERFGCVTDYPLTRAELRERGVMVLVLTLGCHELSLELGQDDWVWNGRIVN